MSKKSKRQKQCDCPACERERMVYATLEEGDMEEICSMAEDLMLQLNCRERELMEIMEPNFN
jgi:hypothetical protein